MSLQVDGVWAGGVWAATVWGEQVWYEPAGQGVEEDQAPEVVYTRPRDPLASSTGAAVRAALARSKYRLFEDYLLLFDNTEIAIMLTEESLMPGERL